MKKTIMVAFDENIGFDIIYNKKCKGQVCVYQPDYGTPDEVWVLEAFDAGAEIIYSRDLDIPNLIERYGLPVKWKTC